MPKTTSRVPEHTSDKINEKIRRETERNIVYYAGAGPDVLEKRLEELDREWDIERILEMNASMLALLGLTLGATVSRRWFILPAVVTGFLLQHALQGWCPPVPVLRRAGIRTAAEIDHERYALKALRGDFQNLPPVEEASRKSAEIYAAVER
ncbi:MAG: DUF2892 domain-containing protein [Candidatus Abyssobacteria bacterium SURF_5]|uniref:DUF2892 domain-containing protein n=1 Tax=Abyssobacteria bacterium (strain SURF_5) TaxID=2093360 RepID=A0A3A4P4X2_ABYX5|nr:MAG: DUF2892 domain-containing protein [Candidatus Abyssubacteria bacterium SURF_5]